MRHFVETGQLDVFFEKKLGSGDYCAVYLAKNKVTGEKVAIKAMQKSRISEYEAFQNKISILRVIGIQHKLIVLERSVFWNRLFLQ